MEKVVWDESFSVGDQDIDLQHRRLVDLVNAVIAAPRGRSPEKTADLVVALERYVQFHLAQEERAIQPQASVPPLSSGPELTALFRGLDDLARQARAGNSGGANASAAWLSDWCRQHLCVAARRLRGRGVLRRGG